MTLLRDLYFAARSLRKSPLFTTVTVVSVALGIGANAAVFTLLDQVVLRALPVEDPTQSCRRAADGSGLRRGNGRRHGVVYPCP